MLAGARAASVLEKAASPTLCQPQVCESLHESRVQVRTPDALERQALGRVHTVLLRLWITRWPAVPEGRGKPCC